MIKIQNIYYMLSYAFEILNVDSYERLAVEEFQYASDLFAAILAKGIANQLKRGLGREYINISEPLSSPVGKINVTESLKKQTLLRRQLACDFDNYTENEYMNKVLKTTVKLLIRTPEVANKQKKSLKKVLLYFDDVEEIDPYKVKWNLIKYHRNNSTYKMLINICYLVIEGMLMSNKEGIKRLAKYLDDQMMHRLYEKFVLEFYRKHYPEYNASSMHIDWNVDNKFTDFLPMMKTDITLKYHEKTLIIDTKYYGRTMQVNCLYNSKTIHSNNLYQIYTYVKNYDVHSTGLVSGVLLYARTNEDIVPDFDYIMSGNKIGVKTLDLDTDFNVIKTQLNNLIDLYF